MITEYLKENEEFNMGDCVYLVDVGILYNNADKNEYDAYSTVYDHKHAYYDEGQFYVQSYEEAIRYVNAYVKQGVSFTYGIVSETELSVDEAMEIVNDYGLESVVEIDVDFAAPEYGNTDSIIYSVVKSKEGKIIEDFVGRDELLDRIGLSKSYQDLYSKAKRR